MALLRSCGRCLIQTFAKMPRTCQMCLLSLSTLNVKRGYSFMVQTRHSNEQKYSTKLIDDTNPRPNLPSIDLQNRVEVLRTGFKEMRVDYQHLLHALKIYSNLRKNIDNIDNSVGVFLLRCCGEVLPDVKLEDRRNLAEQIWKTLQKTESSLPLNYYHVLLLVCAENCQAINAEEFLKSMTAKPDGDVYSSLLNVAAKTRDLKSINYVLQKMNDCEYPLTQENLTTLIGSYLTLADIESAGSIFKTVIEREIEQQSNMSFSLAYVYILQNNMEKIVELLETYSFNDEQLITILRHLCLSGDNDYTKILKYLPLENISSNHLLTNTIITLVHSGKIDSALGIVNHFTSHQPADKIHNLVRHFLTALVRAKYSAETVLQYSTEFSTKYAIIDVLHHLLGEALYSANSDLAFVLLKEMKTSNIEIRPHYYWPLLKHASKQGEPGIFSIIDHMLHFNVQLDHTTLLEYVIPYISTSDAPNTLAKLKNHGIPQTMAINSLVCYYLNIGQPTKSLLLLTTTQEKINSPFVVKSLIKSYVITNDINACANVLQSTNSKKDPVGSFLIQLLNDQKFLPNMLTMEKIIDSFHKYNLRISNVSAEVISRKLWSITGGKKIIDLLRTSKIIDDNWRNSVSGRISGIPHPKDMNISELECHLIELKSRGLNYRGVLRKLFIVHCKNNNLSRVKELQEELNRNDIQLTAGMKAQLFELYAVHGQVAEIHALILDLQKNHQNFEIDSSKILRAATAFTNQNDVKTALEIINNAGIVSDRAPRECWQLLNAIARSEKSKLTEPTLNILVAQGFCTINNTVLGPIIRQHIHKNDLSSAVKAFKSIARKFNCTPLRQELVNNLVKAVHQDSLENETKIMDSTKKDIQKMLQEVNIEIARIYGDDTVEMELIISHARWARLSDLKALLQETRYPTKDDIETFITAAPDDKDRLKVLTRILDASRGSVSIDRQSLYELVLAIHYRSGSSQDAIELWAGMKKEGLNPSATFRNNLGDLLKAHKVELPSDLSFEEHS